VLIQVSKDDFDVFAKKHKKQGKIDLDIYYSGESALLFRKGSIIAAVADSKFYLSESVVISIRSEKNGREVDTESN